jgi:hypothetical protein
MKSTGFKDQGDAKLAIKSARILPTCIDTRIENLVFYHWHWYCNLVNTPGAYTKAYLYRNAFCSFAYSA